MAKLTVDPRRSNGTVSRYIYGHFSEHLGRCIYGGIFVGKDSPIPNVNGMRTDVVQAMRAIDLPVLRWPGGCFADEYHWQDGIGPQENRKRMVNTNWGGVVEDNSFGTHEFLELCRQVGCEPYICGNVGSGTVREMSEWIEYINSDGDSSVARQRWANGQKDAWTVKFWGVGNENWGCGGNMRPEYYADEYRRYQGFCHNYSGKKLYKIACGPNGGNAEWTDVLMKQAGWMMDGLSMHYYTVCGDRWEDKGPATGFTSEQYFRSLNKSAYIEQLIKTHSDIMDRYDPEKRVGLIVDEWGNWYDVEPGTNPGFLYQQNTMRDAMVAAISLDIFNRHCDRVKMANIAQVVNVLQSIILTEGDQMVLTPTYYVFDLYRHHMDARQLDCLINADEIGEGKFTVKKLTASASEKDGIMTVTVSNTDPTAAETLVIDFSGRSVKKAEGRILHGEMGAYNDFGNAPLAIQALDGIEIAPDGLSATVTLPACAVAEIRFS